MAGIDTRGVNLQVDAEVGADLAIAGTLVVAGDPWEPGSTTWAWTVLSLSNAVVATWTDYVDLTTGVISINVPAAQVAALGVGRYVHRLEVDDGVERVWLAGPLQVHALGASRPAARTLGTLNVGDGQDIAISMPGPLYLLSHGSLDGGSPSDTSPDVIVDGGTP